MAVTSDPAATLAPGEAGTIDVGVLGTVIRIRTPDPESTEQVRRAWHLALLPESDDGRAIPPERTVGMSVAGGGSSSRSHGHRARAMVAVTQAVTRAALAARAGRAVHLHAGGVCHPRTGAAFVYVAPGGTGKTTLTKVLGPGNAYLSDETIAVRADGTITPYLKPLSVRRGGHDTVKDEVAPGEVGLVAPTVTAWLAGLVVLRRVAGATLDIESVGTLDAIMALSPECSSMASLDRPLRRVADVVERAGGLRIVTYSEAHQLVPLMNDALGRAR